MSCRHPSKIKLFTLACICIFFAAPTAANQKETPPLTSKQIIDNYRDLRAQCAKAQGAARRLCYAQLNDATNAYQQAKERITQTDPGASLLSSR